MASIPKPFYFYRSQGNEGLEVVRPVLGSFNLVVSDEAHIYPKHQHLNYQLIFAQKGFYRCVLNNVGLTLKPRDILIVKRGDWHEDVCGFGLRYLAINFDLAGNENLRSKDILFGPDITAEQQVLRGPNTDIWRILARMQDESKRDDAAVGHIENALLMALFWLLVRALPRDRLSPIFIQQSAVQAFSERLRRLFDRHLTESPSTAVIAKKLNMSVRTLTKRCQEVIGRPPARAFMHFKMEYAARVLRQTEIPIKEISYRLGFQDQYHFSRVFRRHFATPPSKYRGTPK